jgi:Domain of unknown function (DUF397)
VDLAYNGMPASRLRLAAWRKSRYSNPGGNCVEMAELLAGSVAVRNSRIPDRQAAISPGLTGWRSVVVSGTAISASQHDRAGCRRGTHGSHPAQRKVALDFETAAVPEDRARSPRMRMERGAPIGDSLGQPCGGLPPTPEAE